MRIKQKYMIDFAKGITWLLVLFLIKIVKPEIVSINFPCLIKFGKKSMLDSFRNNLDLN